MPPRRRDAHASVAIDPTLFVASNWVWILADRVFALESPVSSIVGGAAWGFVSFIFGWCMLLPIARDGAPLRPTTVDPTLFVASNWVWILGYTLSGLMTGAVYAAVHRSRLADRGSRSATRKAGEKLRYAS